MILKNIGNKVISIGSMVLMPDAQMEISADMAALPSIKAMCDMKFLAVEKAPEVAVPVVETEPEEESAKPAARKPISAKKTKEQE